MKIIINFLILMKIITIINSSVIEKSRNDIKSKNQKSPKKIRHSERVLNDVNQKLKKILAQRSQIYETQRNLRLNPKKHLNLVLSSKNQLMKFSWKDGDLTMASESSYRGADGKIKVIVALENRFPERDVVKSQMQCTLHVMNHGIQYLKIKKIARFRVDFRSNCFRNTFTKYFIGNNLYKNPVGVKVSLGFVKLEFMFKNFNTGFNFTYYMLPQYTTKKNLRRRRIRLPTVRDYSISAHTRKLTGDKIKAKISRKLERDQIKPNFSRKSKNVKIKENLSRKLKSEQIQGNFPRKLRTDKIQGVEKRKGGPQRVKNTKGFRKRKGGRVFRKSDRVLFNTRYRFKSSRYSFDIVSNFSKKAFFSYDTLKRIWTSSNTGKCHQINLPSLHLTNLFRKQPIGMRCSGV